MTDTPPTSLEYMAVAENYFTTQEWRLPLDTTRYDLMKTVQHQGNLDLESFRQLCADTVNDAVLADATK